ncbi:MAG: prepilin peptidase [Clostridiales bacterium]|nr:prepilin peptidase [Clostridiales bacterium]
MRGTRAGEQRTSKGFPERRNTFIYRDIQMVSLTGIAMTAVLCDLWAERIPNAVIAAGLAMGMIYQLFEEGPLGLILFLGGALLPLLLLGGLYFFRMLGAGDIKLLCVAGGFFGPAGVFVCLMRSLFAAGVLSLLILYRHHELGERLGYFLRYVSDYAKSGQWRPYLDGVKENARFCFSVPVLIGILLSF